MARQRDVDRRGPEASAVQVHVGTDGVAEDVDRPGDRRCLVLS
jgi:hypothetical protein